ncbi:MAG: phosphoribosylaminoimidazole carboxylase ade2 [Geoglossum umbratile]|nr:MAG: phosphoribosylaminoimidazole carboxylase ade2 [Geoglossum umbratile]
MDDRTVGILGGGQLGRMLTEAAHRMNLRIAVLDSQDAPAKQINARHPHVDGSFTDPNAIRELARQCDILTVEIEHVNTNSIPNVCQSGFSYIQGKFNGRSASSERSHTISPGQPITAEQWQGRTLGNIPLHSTLTFQGFKDAPMIRGNMAINSGRDLVEADKAARSSRDNA